MSAPTLYRHQIEGIKFAAEHLRATGGAYLAHDVGLGKSLSAICVARLLRANRIMVITTLAGVGVWKYEMERWWPGGPSAYIINYDKLLTVKAERSVGWDLLILDEAQKVKNGRAKRSRAVQKIRKASRHVLLLSGTPAHTPLDYHAQMRLIAPTEKPWSLTPSAYKALICKFGGPYLNWIEGYKKEEVAKIEKQLALHMHKATKDELHLPEPIRTVVPVQLSEGEWKAYREMEKRLRVELAHEKCHCQGPLDRCCATHGAESTAPIILTKILRLQQITSGFLRDTRGVDHQVGTSKLNVLMDLLEERAAQKVVVAFRFQWELGEISRILTNNHAMPWAFIDGSTRPDQRTWAINEFQTKPGPMVLLLQAQAGGTAITLTAADCLIKFSQIPSVIDDTQLTGRVHRIGTTKFVQIIDLIAEGTIDVQLQEGLKAKSDLVALTSLLRKELVLI